MKKSIIILLAIVSLGFFACKSDSSQEPHVTKAKRNLPVYQYLEEDFSLLYNQIYEVIAHINEDSVLMELLDPYLFNDSLIFEDIHCLSAYYY